jgi:hypothetical protein
MNILTQVPIDEIPKAIAYIRSRIDPSQSAATRVKLNSFWNYFRSTWCQRYNPQTWNVNAFLQEDAEIMMINRTDNPLERFNRRMNQAFPTAHPTMQQFVVTIKGISKDYVYTLDRIAKGTMARPVHEPATIYPIPED